MKQTLEKILMDETLKRFAHWESKKIPWYRSSWKQPRKTHTPDVIYVLESGFGSGSFEGRKLYERFRDFEDGNAVYMSFDTAESFARCIVGIMNDFMSRSGKISAMPFIHLSAHAQEDGIIIEAQQRISWLDLFDSLNFIRMIFSPVMLPNSLGQIEIPPFSLLLSTCHGKYFAELLASKNEFPIQHLIYYPEELHTNDAYDAFHSFYLKERLFSKESYRERVMAINNSLSKNFVIVSHPDFKKM